MLSPLRSWDGRRMASVLVETSFPNLNLFHRGKVRDTYDLGDALLMVATDRVSAFDIVLPTPIPERGMVLAELSAFWFRKTAHLVPNHFLGMAYEPEIARRYSLEGLPPEAARRAMVVRKAQRVDIECVVRGYLAGSALAEYQRSGTINGCQAPEGLRESDQLQAPIFTPTTKAETGHDQPLTLEELWERVGGNLAWPLEEHSLALYNFARDFAKEKGIIVADTKFEFGFIDGYLCAIDEMLTPDSSRFWDLATYQPSRPQPSFDKQIVRDWLTQTGWSREPPAPPLPPEIVERTAERYKEVYRRLTGQDL